MDSEESSHEFFDHTSELGIRIRSADRSGIFSQACVALSELQHPDEPPPSRLVSCNVDLSAKDLTALLVDWLNELVFLAETKSFLPSRAEVLSLSPTTLQARVSGPALAVPPALVKAATYHGARVEERDGHCLAEVVLDI